MNPAGFDPPSSPPPRLKFIFLNSWKQRGGGGQRIKIYLRKAPFKKNTISVITFFSINLYVSPFYLCLSDFAFILIFFLISGMSPLESTYCYDRYSNCSQLSRLGYCRHSTVKSVCKKSCNLCWLYSQGVPAKKYSS